MQRCVACKQTPTEIAVVGFPAGTGNCVCAACTVRLIRAFFRGAKELPKDAAAQLAVRMLRLALAEQDDD